VVSIGLASTDMLYFASGQPGPARVQCSPRATIRPATNGIKLCRCRLPRRSGQDSGLAQIRAEVEQGVPTKDVSPGTVSERDLLGDYADYLRNLVDLTGNPVR